MESLRYLKYIMYIYFFVHLILTNDDLVVYSKIKRKKFSHILPWIYIIPKSIHLYLCRSLYTSILYKFIHIPSSPNHEAQTNIYAPPLLYVCANLQRLIAGARRLINNWITRLDRSTSLIKKSSVCIAAYIHTSGVLILFFSPPEHKATCDRTANTQCAHSGFVAIAPRTSKSCALNKPRVSRCDSCMQSDHKLCCVRARSGIAPEALSTGGRVCLRGIKTPNRQIECICGSRNI